MTYQKGFTLIESLIYLALFTIIIGGGLVSVYQIIQSTNANKNHIILQEEANFLFRKMNGVLVGTTSISQPTNNSDTDLVIIKNGSNISFHLTNASNGDLTLNGTLLNSESVKVSLTPTTHLFEHVIVAGKPDAIVIKFTLTTVQNGRNVSQNFSFTKYLR
jgi:prepilin-type N-terminal cleavage/methylation domain-containing protein